MGCGFKILLLGFEILQIERKLYIHKCICMVFERIEKYICVYIYIFVRIVRKNGRNIWLKKNIYLCELLYILTKWIYIFVLYMKIAGFGRARYIWFDVSCIFIFCCNVKWIDIYTHYNVCTYIWIFDKRLDANWLQK